MNLVDETRPVLCRVYWRMKSLALQWSWFLPGIQPRHIGYDYGPLTWLKERKHRHCRKQIHICLLEYYPPGGKFGRFMSFWINERSLICSASLNDGMNDADVFWIYSQDPIPSPIQTKLLRALKKGKTDVAVINHPLFYNAYHEVSSFQMMEKAGIGVPRTEFNETDIGKTLVVYKMVNAQACPKFLSPYRGVVDGYRAFEFIDSRASNGLYVKYRALYLAGFILPEFILYSDQWNVVWKTKKDIDYSFEMKESEGEMIHRIADVLQVQYFTVDYVRRGSDNARIVTDINVYPLPIAYTEIVQKLGYYGRWLRFDDALHPGIQRGSHEDFWHSFDHAMENFVRKR